MERRLDTQTCGALEEELLENSPSLDEALLIELRLRRERLKQLIRLIAAEVGNRDARQAKPRCRRRASH